MSRRIKPHKVRGREFEEVPTDASCITTGPSTHSVRCSAPAPSTRRCTMPPRTSRPHSSSPSSTRSGSLPVLRVPGTGREPELNERQLHARRRVHEAMAALGGISSPGGSCVWHVVGLQRSVREWALHRGWGGRPVRQEQAQGILIAALGILVAYLGYGEVRPGLLQDAYASLDDRFRIG
jgi:hypothetical protein